MELLFQARVDASTFSPDQIDLLKTVTTVASALSLAGCLLIIGTHLKWKELGKHFFGMRLVFFISLADAVAAGAYLLSNVSRRHWEGACSTQGLLLQGSHPAAWCWTSAFAYSLYLHVCKGQANEDLRAREPIYHALCWGFPLVGVVLIAPLDLMTDLGPWCWIQPESPFLRLLVFYAPLLILILFNSVLYTAVIRKLKANTRASASKLTKRVTLYLGVGLITMIPAMANRIHDAISPGQPLFALTLLQALFTPLQGFLNVFVYGLTLPVVRDKYSRLLSRHNPDPAAVRLI